MPRLLNDAPCEVTFQDRISGSNLLLYHRIPTTEERIAYANEQIVRKGNKVVNNSIAVRQKYGLRILTGFREGDFEKEEGRPLSSDPKSAHYDPAWKTYVGQYAADIVNLLAVHVFEASVLAAPAESDEEPTNEPEAGEEGKEGNPL